MKNIVRYSVLAVSLSFVGVSFAANQDVETLAKVYGEVQEKLDKEKDTAKKQELQTQLDALALELEKQTEQKNITPTDRRNDLAGQSKTTVPVDGAQVQLCQAPLGFVPAPILRLQEQLKNIQAHHAILVDPVFTHNSLDQKDQNRLMIVSGLWEKLCSNVADNITALESLIPGEPYPGSQTQAQIDDAAQRAQVRLDLEKQIQRELSSFESFVQALKFVRTKLEPITIGPDISDNSVVEQAVTRAEYQSIFLNVYAALLKEVGTCIQKNKNDLGKEYGKPYIVFLSMISQAICNALPESLIGSSWSRALGVTEHAYNAKKLYDIIQSSGIVIAPDCRLHAIYFFDWDRYFALLRDYEKCERDYTGTNTRMLEGEASALLEVALAIGQDELSSYNPVLMKNITDKLCVIKKRLESLREVQTIASKRIQDVDLFIRCQTLLTTKDSWFALETQHPGIDALVTGFKRIAQTYFASHPANPAFLFEIAVLSKQLHDLKNTGPGLASRFVWGTPQNSSVFDDMLSIVTEIESRVSASCLPEKPSAMAAIMSSAGWRSLAQASPILVLTILKYVAPYLQGQSEGALNSFLQTQDQAKQPNHNQLLTFIDKNPDLFKELANKHPELFDILAQHLQR